MIKLIASDLDGTLLRNGATTLSTELFDCIMKLKEKGVHFVAASGRQVASLRSLFGPIADEISYIAENGAVCICNGSLLSTSEIERELAHRIIEHTTTLPNRKTLVSCVDTCYVESHDEALYQMICEKYHNDTTKIDQLTDITDPIIKIAIYDTVNPQETMADCTARFENEIHVVTAGNDWVDFVPFHSNKGIALTTLANHLGVSLSECIAFGDQQNDMEMLQTAGTSYAMSTAKDEVKACATHVTETVEEVLQQLLTTI